MEPILSDSHNGVSNDHQAIENVPPAADYPPEIPEHGKYFCFTQLNWAQSDICAY